MERDQRPDTKSLRPDGYSRNLLDSERTLLATNAALGGATGLDSTNPDTHCAAVRAANPSFAGEPRRVAYPNPQGTVRTLIDKVGR